EPASSSPPYFRIEEEELFGATFYTRTNCESEDPGTCTGGGGLLVEETDDGYRGTASFALGEPPNCTLGYAVYEAAVDDDLLTFESRTYSESGGEPCTTDEAEARGSDMPCAGYELIAGVLVE
ncbi:MAG TPA: hypothetical protein VKZ63_16050, partial [Kofleriaceae bacterium]|nr:hypothetical protein [Kofleriaceae bacterium]